MYKIAQIDAGKRPVLYKLKDLKNAPIAGNYYRQQLTKALKPSASDFFRVEKVIKKKKENGKTLRLLKYTHYPAKFNRWVAEEDMLK